MNALLASLQSLIITVSRNVASSILTVVLIIALMVGYSARGNIATFMERHPTAQQEKVRFDQAVIAEGQVNAALEGVRKRINADRVIIRQFHNSRTDLTGLPFASVSTTYTALAAGVTNAHGSFDPYPLSSINEVLAKMFIPNQTPRCTHFETSTIIDPTYRHHLAINGVSISYACPILNLRGQPVGFIKADYLTSNKERPSDEYIGGLLENTGVRAVGYLHSVIQREKKPWYSVFIQTTEEQK